MWLAEGIDRKAGGFLESLNPEGPTCDATFRRLRVLARQIYVFAQAHAHGLDGADEAVALGIDFLTSRAALPGGGYAKRFDLHNRVIDDSVDTYDQAFVLLALSSAASVLPREIMRKRAMDLVAWMDRHLVDKQGGYQEGLPAALPRRQNPHMHLLEAFLAAFEAFGDEVFLQRAQALLGLFLDRLIDPATGALPEHFDGSLRPERQGGVFVTEPGHHCEWVWLLRRCRALPGAGDALPAAETRLIEFVDRHAIHPGTGDIVDLVGSDGQVLAASARLWPQTERLRMESLGAALNPGRYEAAARSLAAYLRPDGLWHERRTAGGEFIVAPSPASSLYHLTSAILAVLAPG